MRMRTMVMAGAIFLGACAGVTLASVVSLVVSNAQAACSVIVNAEQLTTALTGFNPATINVVALVNSICSQFQALAAAPSAQPSATPPQASAEKCYDVSINGKSVQVCKQS